MRFLLMFILVAVTSAAQAATARVQDFKIQQGRVSQVLADDQALIYHDGELVLCVGLDFTAFSDGQGIRSDARFVFDGNYSYTNALGARKTVKRIVAIDDGKRRKR